ncbi:MAG: ATP-binding protein [Chloroflexi bacterium]|nr:ATP-binding protein [Chloroflexota bacterium]
MFVDRHKELAFLNSLLTRERPGPAQLVLLYGRRRVGKTELLLHWAKNSGIDFTYWAAERESPNMQRNSLFARLLNVPEESAPVHRSWSALWQAVANLLGEKRHILILDELPYAAESDSAMLSALQHAWDQYFQHSNLIIVICGSHVRIMETLLSRQSPLFGRMTAQWHLEPLPFSSLQEFFPNWDAAERVAAYAIVGGIPAYLKWFNAKQSLVENIRNVVLAPGGMFLAEPAFLLYDEVRELKNYLAVLKAIGAGNHTLNKIGEHAFLPGTAVNAYLSTLQELRLVERRLPVTVRPGERGKSRSGRYHLSDPYFRFYFHFLAPFQDNPLMNADQILERIQQDLRAFTGATAFEELCRQWTVAEGKAGNLPFVPSAVGSHWSRHVQVDVVALNWNSKEVLLGECKWGLDKIGRQVARDLTGEKTRLALLDLPDMGKGWQVYHALFGRQGFTDATQSEIRASGGLCINLKELDKVLSQVD